MMEKKSMSIGGEMWFSIIAPFMIIIIFGLDINHNIQSYIWKVVGEAGAYIALLCVIPICTVFFFIFGMAVGINYVTKLNMKELGCLAITLNIIMLLVMLRWFGIF